ncbi:MAG: LD-carboxypeptidase [Planctomycetes bacterium]|nr:LD-carboxypeptidase [Planctomycetota bacterium]
MSKPIIHLWSIAGSDRNIARQLGLRSTPQLVGLVQDAVGPDYKVTANVKLFEAKVNERRGGRSDDAARARDIERALADDRISAIVSVRGGAWLARVLPHVNFDVLKKRKTVVHVFGFSELTALINIVARYPKVRAHYDMGPGFALWGLRNYAIANYDDLSRGSGVRTSTKSARAEARGSQGDRAAFALTWAKANFKLEFVSFFLDVIEIIEGRGSERTLEGRLVRGTLKQKQKIKVAGGCLSTLVTLLGSPYQKCLAAAGRWLAIEDIREDYYRIDRYLAQLKLAGVWERCAGLLIGDFHLDAEDQTDAILRLLKYHLPARRNLPIIAHCNFGHCFPMASLPINQPLIATRGRGRNDKRVEIIADSI